MNASTWLPVMVGREPSPETGRGLDLVLLFSVLFLCGIGVVMVYSASSALALKKYGSDYHFLKKQAAFFLVGIGVLFAFRRIPLRWLRDLSYPFLLLAFAFLLLLQIPELGVSAGGATRWLRMGGWSFQPSEFARFVLVIYLAYSMDKKQERLDDFAIGFLPHALVVGLFALMILFQPDFGSVIILAATAWGMMFVGGVPVIHLGLSMALAVPLGYVFIVGAAYRVERIISFLDPWRYASDGGYQIIHSLMAFGSGGFWGKGIGRGYQKLFYLPEPHTDFIFSVVGEELGLIGVLLILGLYAIIIVKGVRIAMGAKEVFAGLLAAGIVIALGLQVCINMGVALALLPTKGLTLPFVSYGGTSLLLNMASVGILMNIGRNQGNGRETTP